MSGLPDDPMIRDWMFAREMVRRLGFVPDEIYMEVSPSGVVKNEQTGETRDMGGPIIALTLKRGGLRFAWTIGPTALPVAEIQPAFEAACAAWNNYKGDGPVEEFLASRPMRMATHLIVALRDKGFELELSPAFFTGSFHN